MAAWIDQFDLSDGGDYGRTQIAVWLPKFNGVVFVEPEKYPGEHAEYLAPREPREASARTIYMRERWRRYQQRVRQRKRAEKEASKRAAEKTAEAAKETAEEMSQSQIL